jgi:predicted nuclease of restriction endonuclease-like (RecB) superfamily
VLLYWQIGRDILARQAEQGWGTKVIDRLTKDLRAAFPDMKGFSPRNLKYMRAFADAWPDPEFVQGVLAQLPWYHQLALLDKLPGAEVRRWYAAKAIEHNWSRNVLVMQIETRLLERSGQAVTNFPATLPAPQSDLAHESIKDPYRFDFLGLSDEAQEREIEHALVRHVTDFLLELGTGFAFVGRQVLLQPHHRPAAVQEQEQGSWPSTPWATSRGRWAGLRRGRHPAGPGPCVVGAAP